MTGYLDKTAESTAAIFAANDQEDKRRVSKYTNYFAIYDRYSAHLIGTDATLVEIGVQHGGSLALWREYLGPKARIVGVDINKTCLQFAEPPLTEVLIGDQSDP